MPTVRTSLLLASLLVLSCANPDKRTLADLRRVEPDMTEVSIDGGLDRAMRGYQAFLEQAPESTMTPEAMRRLADLKLEKEYGYLGAADPSALPPPPSATTPKPADGAAEPAAPPAHLARNDESQQAFERRAAGKQSVAPTIAEHDLALPGEEEVEWAGPLEAIELYDRILAAYPTYEHNDWVLYQKARAYDELGRTDDAISVMEQLLGRYPTSRYADEVQFRRGEYFFTRKKFLDAEEAYAFITARGEGSEYYELALYKLGWTFYKQEMHDEALDQYVALLDYKVSTGYDFDPSDDDANDQNEERRIDDTLRVISLSFSSLGGPEAIEDYFMRNGERIYEDRIYSRLGEFYLEKLRYHDAAMVYQAFIDLHPVHRVAPSFSMRMVEIYEEGGFPRLVLESKKNFAARYGLESDYWLHFDVTQSPEVLSDLRSTLDDLATHYHAVYQEAERAEDETESFEEALRWYRAYLTSFPEDSTTPSIHHRLADLLLEGESFAEAAQAYEHTAYVYPPHAQSAAAGYAAIYAHREHEKRASGEARLAVTRAAVDSTLRFVDTFSEHEHAAVVLGAAVDDLYAMEELDTAMTTAQRLLDDYPDSDVAVQRAAWAVIANAHFDLEQYEPAERAYTRVLEMTPEDDESRAAVVDSLAATVYKQGEQAVAAEDHRAAADHFLRIARVAPTSDIRPVAEYDAAAALIRLEDWSSAQTVLEAFRTTHPSHELQKEATRQMAFVYREQGEDARAAREYERVADETEDSELRREALLLAGELHESANGLQDALAVYQRYVDEFPEPKELAVETRFQIADLHGKAGDPARRRAELERIVAIYEAAGAEGSPRIRVLAARAALVLSESLYERFREVRLVQPFDSNLRKKRARMDAALEAFEALVDYETAEVTAGATFYIAEIYLDLSQALMDSERPDGLDSGQLNDYEMALEEEAFPFEERAIEVHEKNLELLSIGVFNPWIEKSLQQLATLMPGRYAKFEASGGLIASIDRYAYDAPNAGKDEPAPEEAPEPSAESAPADAVSAGPQPAELQWAAR